MKMVFGKHKGKQVKTLRIDCLKWLAENVTSKSSYARSLRNEIHQILTRKCKQRSQSK